MGRQDTEYDVAVVGASIAGCTAAMLYGRAGLRVALVERNRNVESHKAMCGHFILGGAQPTLQRLGLWDAMLARGAESARARVWVQGGWIEPSGDGSIPPMISLQRKKLDPLLREMAAATPGVDLLMGHAAAGLVEDERGRIGGVTVAGPEGERTIKARLLVGADGHRSAVARLAGVGEDGAPNERFLWWAYYRDVDRPAGTAQIWMRDRDVAVVAPAGDGLTLVGAFPSKARLEEFTRDRVAAIERFVGRLPGAPDLGRAERVSNAVGTNDYPFVRRHPTPRAGLALIGDAAMASDPVPAVGCGWAFRTGEWLADATAPALAGGAPADVDRAMRAYRRARRMADRYDALARRDARALPPNPIQRAIFTAARHDAGIARRVALFANRAAPPSVVLNPGTVLRAAMVGRRSRRLPAQVDVALG